MSKMKVATVIGLLVMLIAVSMSGCIEEKKPTSAPQPTSSSGVTKATVSLKPVINGKTVEQYLIDQRMTLDNRNDVVKYFYLMGMTGQIVMKDVIKYKMVSSGKRLTPRTVAAFGTSDYGNHVAGSPIVISGRSYQTNEIIEDDGTYGDSGQYFFYFTTTGNYVKIIPMGSFIGVESDKQMTPKELILLTGSLSSKDIQ